MLFDLRARGRRRTVKAVYLTLAVLMGGGLVFFGIGGDVQGGLFDAFNGSTTAGDDVVEQRLQRAEEAVAARPRDPAAQAELADVLFQTANSAENYNDQAGAYTEAGRRILRRAQEAFQRHLALAGANPDAELANKMALALGPQGLKDYDAAVRAQEIVVEQAQEPTAAQYAYLSILASLAGQERKSTLAEDRAIELTPKDQREDVRAQIALGKQQAQQGASTVPQPEPIGG